MDCTAAATNLKNLLVAHGNAETQVAALGKLKLFKHIYYYKMKFRQYRAKQKDELNK